MNEKSKENLVDLFQALEKANPSSPPLGPEEVRKDVEFHCKIAELRMPFSPKEIEEVVQSASESKATNNATGLPFTKEELDAAVFPTISIPCGPDVRVTPQVRTEEIIAAGVGQMKLSAAMRIKTHRKLLAHTPTPNQMMLMADLESSKKIHHTRDGTVPNKELIAHWLEYARAIGAAPMAEEELHYKFPKPFPSTDPFYKHGLIVHTRDRHGRLVACKQADTIPCELADTNKHYTAEFVKEQLKPFETPLFSFFKKLAKKR